MKKANNTNIYKPLVIAGYAAFGIFLISILFSTTIPWSNILLNQNSIKLNAFIAMAALTIGAVLPPLIGYFVGDHSVKSKSKLNHHFHGVLFGLLSYWVMTLFSLVVNIPVDAISDNNVRMMVIALIPSSAVALVTVALAIAHTKSRDAKKDILVYTPFVVFFMVFLIAVPLYTVLSSVFASTVDLYVFIMPAIMALFWTIAYASLRETKLAARQKGIWAAVSLTMLLVIVLWVGMLSSSVISYVVPYPTMGAQAGTAIVSTILAVAGWCVYWSFQVRALGRSKK